MSRKRFTALIIAASTLASCTTPPKTSTAPHPSAQLGTVSPAYPAGARLADGTEVIEAIPTAELSTTEPLPMDAAKPCTGMPAEVVTPAGVTTTPVLNGAFGCVWQGSNLAVEIGVQPDPMVKEVEEHVAMANGGSTDQLAHLAWLRIDGHYAIERILEFDPTKSCWLSLDVSSPAALNVAVYRIDSTGEPAKSDTETSVNKRCPIARKIARNLLDHLDGDAPGWWETVIHPTG